ncbi:cyclase family protein [uncultured Clostridium sp.]|uniref:cyclase family protein n=1 Tax=uncultured Clostridium sp. TaxID=59620 RepID=UPI002589023C|nr:cyclase family protein [uncultured Clostridium sp.]MDU1350485.1 cyclase family protein [Clostridium argentinense]
MNKDFYDVSIELSSNTAVYTGDPNIEIEKVFNISKGDKFNLSKLIFTTHSGTHIDAPKHFFNNGYGVEEIPIEKLIGKVKVFELLNCNKIEKQHLEKFKIESGDRIFLKQAIMIK